MHIFTAGDRNYILGLAALLKSIDLNVSKSGQAQVKISIVSMGIGLTAKGTVIELLQIPRSNGNNTNLIMTNFFRCQVLNLLTLNCSRKHIPRKQKG